MTPQIVHWTGFSTTAYDENFRIVDENGAAIDITGYEFYIGGDFARDGSVPLFVEPCPLVTPLSGIVRILIPAASMALAFAEGSAALKATVYIELNGKRPGDESPIPILTGDIVVTRGIIPAW